MPKSAPAADGADSLLFARAVPPAPVVLRATTQPTPADQGTEDGSSRGACYSVVPNREVERGGVAVSGNDADLSQSSTPSLARRRCAPSGGGLAGQFLAEFLRHVEDEGFSFAVFFEEPQVDEI